MATEDIGALVARVVADNNKFRADMLEMGRQVESSTARMNKALTRVNAGMGKFGNAARAARNFAAAFGLALSVRALVSFAQRTVQAARELDSLSKRLGGSTEALSELQYVAEQSDVQFNVLSLGLQRMTRRIAEAAEGSGEAVAALKELGLSATQLARLSLDEQFEVLADRLAGVESESHRVRLAMKLFDSEGVALLQTMTRGAAGIRDMRREARELGVTLSSEAAANAAQAAQETLKFQTAANSLARDLTLALIPALTDAVEWWRRFLFPTGSEELRQQLEVAQKDVENLRALLAGALTPFDRRTFEGQLREAQQVVVDIFNQVQELERAREAAESARPASTAALASPGGPDVPDINAKFMEAQAGFEEMMRERQFRLRNQTRTELEELLESLKSREEIEREAAERRLEILSQAYEREFITRARYHELSNEVERRAQEEITQIRQEAEQNRTRIQAANAADRISGVISEFATLINLVGVNSKRQFDLQKKLAIASAILSGISGVARTLGAYPYPFNLVMAGLHAAVAAAQVQAARSASFGGAAIPSIPASSGAVPITMPEEGAGTGGTATSHRRNTLQVIFQGPVYGWDEYIRSRVVAGIREAVNDKDVVLIDSGSRQAALLGASS